MPRWSLGTTSDTVRRFARFVATAVTSRPYRAEAGAEAFVLRAAAPVLLWLVEHAAGRVWPLAAAAGAAGVAGTAGELGGELSACGSRVILAP